MQSALIVTATLILPVYLLCARVPLLNDAAVFLGSWILTLVASYWLACFLWNKTLRRSVDTAGKAVLVTGCDTGFGHHAAKRFADVGFTVFAGCLNAASDGAQDLAKRANVRVLQLDITKDEQVEKALEAVRTELGSNVLWAVLANAGIPAVGPVEWNSMERIKQVFEVNVFGHVRVAKAFLPLLKKSKGRLVFVTSGLCRATIPGMTVYCMSKHAMLSLVDGLRRECEDDGVDVAAVEPTAYRTNMLENIACPKYVEADLKLLSEEARSLIPEDSVGGWAKFLGGMFDILTRDNPMEVVDQMTFAVMDTRPRPCYRSMTLPDKFYLLFVKLFPDEVLDVFFTLFRAAAQFVK
ncbi:D-beta-hydroxybutyrate dehydrogenase, mitochondrial-like [Dermacentor albipictus]|uniref:D-beta-hydroxybutyrate dehydrogenase, mitochondrial-like n=1 Tax=Dermacentor albipictus TaxID=60249 RepID=UPI0038FC7399